MRNNRQDVGIELIFVFSAKPVSFAFLLVVLTQALYGNVYGIRGRVELNAMGDSAIVHLFAKIYAQPSTDSERVAIANDGDRLPIDSQKGGWRRVRYQGGEGWVSVSSGMSEADLAVREDSGLWIPLFIASAFGVLGILILLTLLLFQKKKEFATLNLELQASQKLVSASAGGERDNRYQSQSLPKKTVHKPMLEGELKEGELGEILQFLETGQKTGMLCIENETPVGMLCLQKGIITLAQTTLKQGHDAVMEILSISKGTFKFFQNRPCDRSNCHLIPTNEILGWARWKDEQSNLNRDPTNL